MHLHRPLIFFDLETTGTNTATDRIVQIGALKLMPDGTRVSISLKLTHLFRSKLTHPEARIKRERQS